MFKPPAVLNGSTFPWWEIESVPRLNVTWREGEKEKRDPIFYFFLLIFFFVWVFSDLI